MSYLLTCFGLFFGVILPPSLDPGEGEGKDEEDAEAETQV